MCVSNYELPVLITLFGSIAAYSINEKLPVALRSKALVCGRLIAWIAVWNSTDGVDVHVCLLCGFGDALNHSFRGVLWVVWDLETSTMK
jgi:hypothetical protein